MQKSNSTETRSIISDLESDVTAATSALTTAQRRLEDARQELHSSEREEATERTRTKIRTMLAEMAKTASEADEAFARYVGAVSRLRTTEEAARQAIENEMHRIVSSGAVTKEAITDASNFLRVLRNGTAGTVRPFASDRTEHAVRRISDAAGIPRQ